jgi:hypothetical protein
MLLAKYPVVQTEYDSEDPWREWLRRELLTRSDGLWLAEGLDRPPLATQENLLEAGTKEVVLTGNKQKLLALLDIKDPISDRVVVAGHWSSSDKVSVGISSALVRPGDARRLARQLAAEDPFDAWLPTLEAHESGVEHSRNSKKKHVPWIVWPSTLIRLDGKDPLGAGSAVHRPRFSKAVNAFVAIKSADAFGRKWVDCQGQLWAMSEAWGRAELSEEEHSRNGNRLVCHVRLLEEILTSQNAELLLLLVLSRCERAYRHEPSDYWHTSAVIRVKKSLEFEYYAGAVNQLHQMRF